MESKNEGARQVRKLEEELKEAGAQLEKAALAALDWEKTFNSLRDAVWLLDRDQRIARANRAAEALFPEHSEDIVGKRCWEVVHKTDGPVPDCPILMARKSLKRETMELTVGERCFLVTVDPMLDKAGGFAGAVHVISDITETKTLIRDLKEREEDFHQLFEAESDAVFLIHNETGRIIRANEAASAMYGYTAEELTAMRNSDLSAEPEETTRVTRQSPVVKDNVVKIPLRWHRRKSGERFPVEITGRFFLRQGTPVHIAAIRDIAERLRAEEEKNRLQEQLHHAQRLESVGRLAGGVAHDFNNMLGVIIGHGEILLDHLHEESEAAREVKEMLKAAGRSAELTRQLLAFARRQPAVPRLLDLNDTINNTLRMLRRTIGEGAALSWMPGPSLWQVKMDPAQIDQILINLCVNARDAIRGTGRITIETRNAAVEEQYCESHAEARPGDYVLLSVSDDGCGMDKETLGKIFEPFFTTKAVGEGTGLGLATVYGIVKQNNGFINVYSEPGHGSTFKVFIPRVEEVPSEAPGREPQARLEGSETVLLVEDEESVMLLGKRILERYGYRVMAARDPLEAVSAARDHKGPIDLLVTDVIMPRMNGKELKSLIEAIKPGIKVLYMSGYGEEVIMQKGIIEKGAEFLQKPFSVKGLASKVRTVLDSAS